MRHKTLALIHLAALFFNTGQYRMAIDQCRTVFHGLQHKFHCKPDAVRRTFLPKISNIVDIVLGLIVFYHYIESASVSDQQHTASDISVFCPTLFTHYIRLLCSVRVVIQQDELVSAVAEYHECFRSTVQEVEPCLFDVLLFKLSVASAFSTSTETEASSRPTLQYCDGSSQTLSQLLIAQASELLTQWLRDFSPEMTASFLVFSDTIFSSFSLYNCGSYQRCLSQCLESRDRLQLAEVLFDATFPTDAPYVMLLGDNLCSVVGMAVILIPEMIGLDYVRNNFGARRVTQFSVVHYLIVQCMMKLGRPRKKMAWQLDRLRDAVSECDEYPLDRLLLFFVYRKAMIYLRSCFL